MFKFKFIKKDEKKKDTSTNECMTFEEFKEIDSFNNPFIIHSFERKLKDYARKYIKDGLAESTKAMYYLIAINSGVMVIVKSDDVSDYNLRSIDYNLFDKEPEITKDNINNFVDFCSKSGTLRNIKESLVNRDNFFITLADGIEIFVNYNDVDALSIKRIYSYEQLRKIIKAREDSLEIGGWTDELAEHIEQ